MLKNKIIAEITRELLQNNPALITRVPKEEQKLWQVEIVLKADIRNLHRVNPDLLNQDLIDYVIEIMETRPKDYLPLIKNIPKKYHNKKLVNILVNSLRKNKKDWDLYAEYIAGLREDLITRGMVKFVVKNAGNSNALKLLNPKLVEKFTKFRPIKKNIKRSHLPKNLDKMQIVILRYMRNNDLDVITVPQLKKANLVTPDADKMIQFYKGKPLTIKDIISYKMEEIDIKETGTVFNFIKKNMKPIYLGKYRGIQRLFKTKINHIFAITINNSNVLLKKYPDLGESIDPANTHFQSPISNNFLLGWIRYTKFGKDIWIDEIQSDVSNDYYFKEILGSADVVKIYDLLLNEFIRNMHRRGSGRILLPTYDVKGSIYEDYGRNRPPKYIYDKLPKKFRFKKDTVTNIDDKVDGLDSWILAHVKK